MPGEYLGRRVEAVAERQWRRGLQSRRKVVVNKIVLVWDVRKNQSAYRCTDNRRHWSTGEAIGFCALFADIRSARIGVITLRMINQWKSGADDQGDGRESCLIEIRLEVEPLSLSRERQPPGFPGKR